MNLLTKKDIEKMDEEERTSLFLSRFKSFEAYLERLMNKDKYTSYSQCLNVLYKHRSIKGLDGDAYDFLRSVGELRNIISHHNDICSPSIDFLYKFIRLSDSFMYPIKSIDIATPYNKMLKASLDDKVSEVIRKMKEKSFTHVPVIEDNRLAGVFSISSFFELATKGCFTYSLDTKIKDLVIELDSHSSEKFVFVDEKTPGEYLKQMFVKTVEHEKRTAVIFVTSDGNKNSKLLGMITQTDLLKLG